MDNEKLIRLVFDNKCLWDMSMTTYHNRDIARQTWKKIAQEMNSDSESVKNKWRGLRDTFRKELIKLPKKPSGEAVTSSWRYFKFMEFLKDQFKIKNLEGNVPGSDENYKDIEDPFASVTCSIDEIEASMHTKELPSSREASPEHFVPEKKKARTNSSAVDKLLLSTEQKRKSNQPKCSSSCFEDSDYHFLMSLLPYLRKIPDQRKIIVRTKLQNVFCYEELSGEYRAHSIVSTLPTELTNLTEINSLLKDWACTNRPTDGLA